MPPSSPQDLNDPTVHALLEEIDALLSLLEGKIPREPAHTPSQEEQEEEKTHKADSARLHKKSPPQKTPPRRSGKKIP